MLARAIACCALMAGPAAALDMADLPGWDSEDHEAALSLFREGCPLMPAEWSATCAAAQTATDARAFFETTFTPHPVPAFLTAYYEPVLEGSTHRTARFRQPIYALPPEGAPAIPRAAIPEALHGRGLEILWLEDAAEAFFLQVQGSGRVRLTDGRTLRVGYAGKNGLPYTSIGRELVKDGAMTVEEATASAVKAWIRAHPRRGAELMDRNASFVFFRIADIAPDLGPVGTMGLPLTPLRSLAVDPEHVPLGAPVWVEGAGLSRLMIAQDTGSAIKGAGRGDIFMGSDPASGEVRHRGRMIVLEPR